MTVPHSKTEGNVVFYARVGSAKTQGVQRSAQAQLALLNEHALANGLQCVGTFVDQASGLTQFAKREGGAALLASLGERNVGEVYCTDLERIGRSGTDILALIKTLQEQGVALRVAGMAKTIDLTYVLVSLMEAESRDQMVKRMRQGWERQKGQGSAG